MIGGDEQCEPFFQNKECIKGGGYGLCNTVKAYFLVNLLQITTDD